MSTVPAIFIKLYRVKNEIITSEESATAANDSDALPIQRTVRNQAVDSDITERQNSLPNAHRLRVTAYILMIILILSTCFTIYLTSFIAIGVWLKYRYNSSDLVQGNESISPFYASLVITVTGFNQNGLSPW